MTRQALSAHRQLQYALTNPARACARRRPALNLSICDLRETLIAVDLINT